MDSMQVDRELDQLLQERFDVSTTEFVAALKLLPESRPWAASLTDDQARLLDDAGFPEDRDAFVSASTEVAGYAAHLAVTAFTAEGVATGLGVSASRVRQKRLAGELWALSDGQTWVFPALQFETASDGRPTRQIRGLDQLFKALPADLHPVAVAGFLRTAQPGLFQGRPMTPVEWLREGGDVSQAITVATSVDWYTM
jgi:hypothetical protein